MKRFFKPTFTYQFLHEEYIVKEKSTYTIAQENNVYAQYVRRSLIHYKIPLRDKSAAQSSALKLGSAKYPKQKEGQNGQTTQE